LSDKGGSYCTSTHPCGVCDGDCDSDNDCQGHLRCWERNTGGSIQPDCGGSGSGATDYCYDPYFHRSEDPISRPEMAIMKPDMDKELLVLERQSNGWNAKMQINPRGVK